MEAPLIAVEEPAQAPSAAAPAARFAFTPARLVGAALALAALVAVSLALPSSPAFSGAKADQDDEETHAPNALAPVTYRSAAEVAAAVPGAIVGGANPLVLCVCPPRAPVFLRQLLSGWRQSEIGGAARLAGPRAPDFLRPAPSGWRQSEIWRG
jgi:hypothetical protein